MERHFSILGSGRCGSTWVHEILSSHPAVALTNEGGVIAFLHFAANMAGLPRFQRGSFAPIEGHPVQGIVSKRASGAFAEIFSRHALQMCREFYRTTFRGRKFRWWGEKLLDLRMALDLQRWMPDAHYVLLVRDPRDVLCSWRAHGRRRNDSQGRLEHLDARVFADSWRAIYEDGAPKLRNTLTVRYEDLLAKPRQKVKAILDHLGLEWHEGIDATLGPSAWFAEHGTSDTPHESIGRWRRDLGDDELAIVEEVCGAPMERFGYPRIGSSGPEGGRGPGRSRRPRSDGDEPDG
ncbi:MAG: sulfotransferase [Planctomycetota bacterium]|nr:sulfotransferase [Planctomycetota bacterium]